MKAHSDPKEDRDYTAAVVASEGIAELLAERSPDWRVIARLAHEVRNIAIDASGSRAAGC